MKELLKSDSIGQSYAEMRKGPVFMTHSRELTWENVKIIYGASRGISYLKARLRLR